MSVKDRFKLIKREKSHETPGFLRQDSGVGSIVLAAPMTEDEVLVARALLDLSKSS